MSEANLSLFNEWNHPDYLWIFDFDLTLYDFSEISVLQSMDQPMNDFLCQELDVEPHESNFIRKFFWKKYGTTLAGLRVEFNTHPDDFFDHIHSHHNIVLPKFNPMTQEVLESIDSLKWIFTNGRRDWAIQGVQSIGIEQHFAKIIDLSDSDWLGKPHLKSYQYVQNMVPPGKQVIFLDDSYDNLMTAKELGWKTVWMRPEGRGFGDFDEHLVSLSQLKGLLK